MSARIRDGGAARVESRPARAFSWPSAATPVAVAVAATIAAWLRLTPIVRGTLWAEDLRNFLKADVETGLAPSLLRPYGGYLQVVPRLLSALVAHLVPVEHWAQAVTLSACAAVGIITAVVFVAARQILSSRVLGAAVAAITVLDPLAAHEVLGNLANLHWFVIWMTPWLLLYRPPTRRVAWVLASVMLLAALSEFDVVLFLPLLGWRFRDRLLWPVRLMFVIGCFAEVIADFVAPRQHPTQVAISGTDLGVGYLINVILAIVSPVRTGVGAMLSSSGTLIAFPIVGAAMFLAAYVLLRGDSRLRILAAGIVILSPGLYAGAVEITPRAYYRYAHLTPAQTADPWLARYGVVPSMLVLALIPLAAAAYRHARSAQERPRVRVEVCASAVVLAVVVLAHVAPTNDQLRAHGPAFAPQVLEAVEACRTAPPNERQQLTAAPTSTWRMSLTCSWLSARGE